MKFRYENLFYTVVTFFLCVLLLSGCQNDTDNTPAAPVSTPTESPVMSSAPALETPEPTASAFSNTLTSVKTLIASGDYYIAFQKIVALEAEYSESPEQLAECEALFSELDALLQKIEPESGTELSRTFSVLGGCVLEIHAFSGPVLVTVTDEYAAMEGNPNPSEVSLYVRQGETGQTYLPAGTYRIRYLVGYRWFGNTIGFGEYCTAGELEEPQVFDFYTSGQWSSNSKYSITL